jgi:sugar (pentulose or hexulose) kinase
MQRTLERLDVGRAGLAELDAAALALSPSAPSSPPYPDDSPAAVWRAAAESATADAARLHAEMTAVVGPHTRLIAAGGWCHSEMVLDAKRRAFGRIEVARVAEAGTRGAATMAARAAGALTEDGVLEDVA